MKNQVEITPLKKNDIDQLRLISIQTFKETFSEENTPENMAMYLDQNLSREKLNIELSEKNTKFYFAKLGQEIIGYLKLNFKDSQTELKDDNGAEIERIYVLKKFHTNKIGQALYEKAVEIARNEGSKYIWLGVWENNFKAIGFYSKNGFIAFDKHIFKLGEDEQTDILMKIDL